MIENIHEIKCALCGKTILSKEIIMEIIDNTSYTFDTNDCVLMFKKFSGVYGGELAMLISDYERVGDVNNVVFPTGACVIDGRLHVYYGGADKVCCLAVVELNAFLEHILNGTINN